MEIKNLNEYKFIVSSGCSYGLLPNSVFKPFNLINRSSGSHNIHKSLYEKYGENWLEIDNDVIVLNVSLGSQGSDWQSDSIIYTINKLIELGVDSKNIYCLVEWSQWSRFSIHPFHNLNLNLERFEWDGDNKFFYNLIDKNDLFKENNSIIDELFNQIQIRTSFPFYNIGKIDERVYITPSSLNLNDFSKNYNEFFNFIKVSKKIQDEYPTEKKVKNYLDNILKTQFYLKSINIKYNFCFMQSTLSNWIKTNNGNILHDLTPPFISETNSFKDYGPNKNFNPISDSKNDIENVLNETKFEISLLDMKNIWFYENEKFRRGGIDEWTIDNFKEVGYINLHEHTERFFSAMDMICDYGHHPNTVSYLLLWNKITTNCDFVKVKRSFEDFMLDRFWEDYHFDGYSKNYVTISKKEWVRRLNQ